MTILENNSNIQQDFQVIASLQRDINLIIAFLLLTGQLTIVGVFITAGGFSVSLSGPIIGGSRLESKFGDNLTNTFIDVIDVVIAVLLIIDEITLISVIIAAGRFSIDVTGPIFGVSRTVPTLPILRRNYRFFRKYLSNQLNIDPTLFKFVGKE